LLNGGAAQITSHTSLITWLERSLAACLLLLALCAPHTIAGTQIAWLLGMLVWVVRLAVRPRPALARTPVDYLLLGFFALTFLSSLLSRDPDISIGKLRAASLFTIVYLVAENVRAPRLLRALTLTLVASCAVGTVYTFAVYAAGRGVKLGPLDEAGVLYAAGVREGDTITEVDGVAVGDPAAIERGIRAARAPGALRWPDGRPACLWDERAACLGGLQGEVLAVYNVARELPPAEGATPEERLGIRSWARGRDDRASGLYGHYTTYAEVLQLVASLALGLLVGLRRKATLRGALLAAALAAMVAALILTVTRASSLALLLSALTVMLSGASRRALALTIAVALPVALAGLFVLQQKRRVGFIDPREGSTAWRLTVWRESLDVLAAEPRRLLVGVGMDSIKRRWREWGMFDGGRLPVGHLHSTPLQLAFERGLPALLLWLALLAVYARTLWRLARRGGPHDPLVRGLALGALGGTVGFFASGLVHYNLGDSEVAMVFYLIMGLTLAADRMAGDTGAAAWEPTGRAAAGRV
jgi:O-antigen ligase